MGFNKKVPGPSTVVKKQIEAHGNPCAVIKLFTDTFTAARPDNDFPKVSYHTGVVRLNFFNEID